MTPAMPEPVVELLDVAGLARGLGRSSAAWNRSERERRGRRPASKSSSLSAIRSSSVSGAAMAGIRCCSDEGQQRRVVELAGDLEGLVGQGEPLVAVVRTTPAPGRAGPARGPARRVASVPTAGFGGLAAPRAARRSSGAGRPVNAPTLAIAAATSWSSSPAGAGETGGAQQGGTRLGQAGPLLGQTQREQQLEPVARRRRPPRPPGAPGGTTPTASRIGELVRA